MEDTESGFDLIGNFNSYIKCICVVKIPVGGIKQYSQLMVQTSTLIICLTGLKENKCAVYSLMQDLIKQFLLADIN